MAASFPRGGDRRDRRVVSSAAVAERAAVRGRRRVLQCDAHRSQLCRDSEVFVVGGGNSAGQAAVILSQSASRVHLLVRGPRLADSMSQYLVDESMTIRTSSCGWTPSSPRSMGTIVWSVWSGDRRAAHRSDRRARHVFTMTGADPCTGGSKAQVALDDKSSSRPGWSSHRTISRRPAGGSTGIRFCSKRVHPASSRWATCVPGA